MRNLNRASLWFQDSNAICYWAAAAKRDALMSLHDPIIAVHFAKLQRASAVYGSFDANSKPEPKTHI
jgi:hypothetical protein